MFPARNTRSSEGYRAKWATEVNHTLIPKWNSCQHGTCQVNIGPLQGTQAYTPMQAGVSPESCPATAALPPSTDAFLLFFVGLVCTVQMGPTWARIRGLSRKLLSPQNLLVHCLALGHCIRFVLAHFLRQHKTKIHGYECCGDEIYKCLRYAE